MNTLTAQIRSLRLVSAGIATVTAAALLLTGCSSDDGSTPTCRTVHSKGGDFVPSGGARPCVVYGTGQSSVAGDASRAATPGSGAKNQTKPKSPSVSKPKAAAPKVAAPKAPAFKAPSLTKR